MTGKPRYELLAPLLATLAPLAAYVYLRVQPHADPTFLAPTGHFYVVSAASLLAAAVAVAAGVAGGRLRNLQVIFLALAMTSLAMVFTLHGLSTPGFILPPTRLPAVAAQLSLLLTAFWLLLSVSPLGGESVNRLCRRPHWIAPLWAALLALVLAGALLNPVVVDWLPIDQAPLRWFVTALTIGCALVAGYRYWQSYRYSRFPLQVAIVYGAGWLAGAQVIVTTGEVWRVSWWIYHFLLLAAMLTLVVGLIRQYGTGLPLSTAVRGLFAVDPRERLQAGISASVRALILATEARDRYTAGHNFRVAMSALLLGEAMDLPPEQLRALAQGGMVHDVGKVEVPDHILNKPGPLTPDERAVIERHPVTGYELCRQLGFMSAELGIIRSHHERWDGTGYPDRLAGEQIPLLARVLAVTDVYDALTSTRSYRKAWSHGRAREYIIGQAGTQFDPRCVQVWARLTEAGPLVETVAPWVRLDQASLVPPA